MKKLGNDIRFIVINHKLMILTFAVFYLYTASQGTIASLIPTSSPNSMLGDLAEAFLNFQTWLLEPPPDQLNNLGNPYNPELRKDILVPWHDVSYFNNKYFVYFSPMPNTFIIMAVEALTGYYLTNAFLASINCLIIGLTLTLIILTVSEQKIEKVNSKARRAILVGSFTLTGAPYLLTRVEVYETVISASVALVLVLTLLCINFLNNNVNKNSQYFWIALFAGLAIWSRPTNFIYIFILFTFIYFQNRRRVTLKNALSMVIVMSIFLVIILYYNYTRYGEFLEFGLKYQLAGKDQSNLQQFQVHHVIPIIYNYFFNSMSIDLNFPYFHVKPSSNPVENLRHEITSEPFIGILAIPINILILGLIFSKNYWKRAYVKSNGMISNVFLSGLGLFLMHGTIGANGNRYLFEFEWVFFVLLSPLVIAAMNKSKQNILENNRIKLEIESNIFEFYTLVRVLFYLSTLIWILSSFDGYKDFLYLNNPGQYDFIKSVIDFPINRILTYFKVI